MFLEKAHQLKDKLLEVAQASLRTESDQLSTKDASEKGSAESDLANNGGALDVMQYLNRAAMDIIGLGVRFSFFHHKSLGCVRLNFMFDASTGIRLRLRRADGSR